MVWGYPSVFPGVRRLPLTPTASSPALPGPGRRDRQTAMSDKEAKSEPGPLLEVSAIFKPFPQGQWSQMTSRRVLSSFFQRGTMTRQKVKYTRQAPGAKPPQPPTSLLASGRKHGRQWGLRTGPQLTFGQASVVPTCGQVKGHRRALPHTHHRRVASSTVSLWGKLPVNRHLRPGCL